PFVAFERAELEMPHLLGSYWSIVRQRTYWEMFTHLTENASSAEEVERLATRLWLVPSNIPLTRQEQLRDSIAGFYSGLAHIFENLANVATDLERGVDWVWSDRTSGAND
ncbi:MAG: hypothetical protein JRN24_02810, partial [Nitrososphaerota archaeon]|nr:hypothetical protein [Nitrososphaerota archaeon]